MDNFRGTKGKWYVQPETDAYTHIVRCDDGEHNSLYIASTSQSTHVENVYNVLLMSKAPELLSKLREIVEAVEDEIIILQENIDKDGYECFGSRFYESAKQLLKEATELT